MLATGFQVDLQQRVLAVAADDPVFQYGPAGSGDFVGKRFDAMQPFILSQVGIQSVPGVRGISAGTRLAGDDGQILFGDGRLSKLFTQPTGRFGGSGKDDNSRDMRIEPADDSEKYISRLVIFLLQVLFRLFGERWFAGPSTHGGDSGRFGNDQQMVIFKQNGVGVQQEQLRIDDGDRWNSESRGSAPDSNARPDFSVKEIKLSQSACKLILASSSPRRRELLREHGYEFEVVAPEASAEDGMCSGETPAEYVARLAYQKAADVAKRFDRGLFLGCDTLADVGGQILGKPQDEDHARRMLELMRGKRHRVISGIALIERPSNRSLTDLVVTLVEMDPLSDAMIDSYLDTDLWIGKSGAFGLQDGIDWVRIVEGSESNVVGLPMERLQEMLGEFGWSS